MSRIRTFLSIAVFGIEVRSYCTQTHTEPTKTDKADSVDPGEVAVNKEADNNQVVVKLEMTTADSEC